jgi:hypothetical protein
MAVNEFEDNRYDSLIWDRVWEKVSVYADAKNLNKSGMVLHLHLETDVAEANIWRRLRGEITNWNHTTRGRFLKFLEYQSVDDFVKDQDTIFTADVIATLYQRAMGICSHPHCKTPTFGPDIDTSRSVNIGVACTIHDASPDRFRYKPLSTSEMISINNAIWLCPTHNELVNANRGANYKAEELLAWKTIHETIIAEWMNGKKTIFFALTLRNEKPISENILSFLDRQKALLIPWEEVNEAETTDCIYEVRAFMSQMKEKVRGTELERTLDATVKVLSFFINSITTSPTLFPYIFGPVQKALGLSIDAIKTEYKVAVPDTLLKAIPCRYSVGHPIVN